NQDFLPENGFVEFNEAEPASLDNLLERFEKDEFDMVAVGRALIANPDWANQVQDGKFEELAAYEKDMLQKLV
ncbi:MAG: 12-oxophytodienoate reductase, partial [Shimia sp.]|nr:12-oxophytodienoate reductase [Shimia sp.]